MSYVIGHLSGTLSAMFGNHSDALQTGFNVDVDSKNSAVNMGLSALMIPLAVMGAEISLNILGGVLTLGILHDLNKGATAFKAGFAKGRQFGTPKLTNI